MISFRNIFSVLVGFRGSALDGGLFVGVIKGGEDVVGQGNEGSQ